jgi:hypothetical protein
MASRFLGSCSPLSLVFEPADGAGDFTRAVALTAAITFSLLALPVRAQVLLKPLQPGDPVNILPSDMAIFEAGVERKDLSCTVTQRKTELGFDLRFHAGYDVTLPLSEVSGDGGVLTVVFRIYPQADRSAPTYYIRTPASKG